MALFIRRAFSIGPIRFNLSKSGIGVSAGVTGARFGITPKGRRYVAGGRHGLYYRKNLPSGRIPGARTGNAAETYSEECALSLEASSNRDASLVLQGLAKIAMGISLLFAYLILWAAQPALAIVISILLVLGGAWSVWRNSQNKRRIRAYEQRIDEALVYGKHPPTPMELDQLKELRAAIDTGAKQKQGLIALETAAYHGLLERVTEDEEVTNLEAGLVKAAEALFALPESKITNIKRDIFVETYLGFIEDQIIEPGELQTLENYVARLELPKIVVESEIDTVNEILRAQRVAWPLTPLPREALEVNLLQSEIPYFTSDAKVLWRKRNRSQPGGYRFDVWREGTLVMTERRFFVVGGGSTEVRYTEVGDIEVDLDTRLICVSKTTSNRPVYLEVAEPIYAGAILNALNEAWRRGDTA